MFGSNFRLMDWIMLIRIILPSHLQLLLMACEFMSRFWMLLLVDNVLILQLIYLKGHSTDFANKIQFTCHGEYDSAREDSCVISSVSLERRFRSLKNKYPDDVIKVILALS